MIRKNIGVVARSGSDDVIGMQSKIMQPYLYTMLFSEKTVNDRSVRFVI
jgi:hypothetical protein